MYFIRWRNCFKPGELSESRFATRGSNGFATRDLNSFEQQEYKVQSFDVSGSSGHARKERGTAQKKGKHCYSEVNVWMYPLWATMYENIVLQYGPPSLANPAVVYARISMLYPIPPSPIRTIVGRGGIGHSTFEVVIQSATLFLKQSVAPASIPIIESTCRRWGISDITMQYIQGTLPYSRDLQR